jgi:hypothetical protein
MRAVPKPRALDLVTPGCMNGMYELGTELVIEMLGEICKAMVIEASSCDPRKEKLRA